jgi:uncharacterized protein YbaP (TraB family)
MRKLRLIFTFMLLPLVLVGCTVKTPAQTPNPASIQPLSHTGGHPALWCVKGPHATVYLFGSVHVLNKDRAWRTPQLDAAVASSQTLWLEVMGADDPKVAQPIIMELGIDAAHPLSTKLSKEQLAKLDTEAKSFNMSEAMMEPMRPWLASITVGLAPIMQAGVDTNSGVESILTAEFNKNKRTVQGFETVSQQFHFFADLPAKTELDYLNLSIDDFAKGPELFKQLVDAWYKGDQEGLDHLFDDEWRAKYPEIYQVLIAKRNLYFAQRIEKLIKGEGTSFVAIGAGHYVGSEGIIALLAKDGFKAERQQ